MNICTLHTPFYLLADMTELLKGTVLVFECHLLNNIIVLYIICGFFVEINSTVCVCVCCSRGSAGSSGPGNAAAEQVKVKQEPGTEEECGFSGTNVKSERGKDGRRSACMVS